MREQTSFALSSVAEANKILDYFNGFHDGFIRRMVIESRDRINEDLSQTCTGVFEVEIDLAHYNYPAGAEGFHPYSQIVRARFRNVQDILCDFREGFLGNTILSLSVVSANRLRGGETATEPCLCLRLARHFYLAEERRYELRETQLFTFTDAVFVEQATA
ncbi:MAG: hypothetical protein LAP39_00610 [Acidobacteriia bacterium]|nr:hypothetical protein [Terriglobia bacterium]